MRLTEAARHFLATSDELYLIGVLHANARFIGEALAAVGEGVAHVELNRVAVEQYGLGWESLDQVRRRVYWQRRSTPLVVRAPLRKGWSRIRPSRPRSPAPCRRHGAGDTAVAVAEGVDPRLVRKWAESQGRVISERGRLSSGLIKDYRRAREPAGE